MSGKLLEAIGCLIATFQKYSGKEGDKYTLSKGEVKDLLTNEFGDLLGNATDKKKLDQIFKDLDVNADGSVDFQEYIALVGCITVVCHDFFKEGGQ